MFLVGLTGGIASGKSAVAQRFVERGAELVDSDVIARKVVEPGQPAWEAIVEHFGADVLAADGTIDRPKLARIVFSDERQRRLLNSLIHPRVADETATQLEALAPLPGLVVNDVPLLVEAGIDRGYHAVVVVATQPETQVRRLVELRGMDEAEARARVAAQAPLSDKLAHATHVLWNEGTLDELRTATDALIDELEALAQG